MIPPRGHRTACRAHLIPHRFANADWYPGAVEARGKVEDANWPVFNSCVFGSEHFAVTGKADKAPTASTIALLMTCFGLLFFFSV